MSSYKLETLVASDNLCGEGPHWDVDSQCLYFVDIAGQTVNRYDPTQKKYTKAALGGQISLVVPWEGKKNTFIVSRDKELKVLKWDGVSSEGQLDSLTKLDEDKQTRFNDGKCDSKGRLWAGTMGEIEVTPGAVEPGLGSLYLLDNSLQVSTKLTKLGIANGLAWSSDNTLMYFIDSCTRRVEVYDFKADTAEMSNKRTVIDFKKSGIEGLPDGMTTDTEGKLWVACFVGKKVIRIDPITGNVLSDVTFPCSQITSVAWGGPRLDELYVTSASKNLKPGKEPMAGSLFKVTGLGQKGFAPTNFVSSS